MLQLVRAITIGSDPTLPAGVSIGISRHGTDVDKGPPARPGGSHLGNQSAAETESAQLVRLPLRAR